MAANSPLRPGDLARFTHRQLVDVTAFNGAHILRYLQVTRRWRWMGWTAGTATLAVAMNAGTSGLGPYFPVTGWLLGVVAGEIAVGRAKSRIRRPLGMRLVPPTLTTVWVICAAISCGAAFSAVVRSHAGETGSGERLGAVATLAVVVVVQAMVIGLHRQPLPAGPADLVGAELATRSRSARSLLAAGAAVALWTSVNALPEQLSSELSVLGLPLGLGLPILAWVKSTGSWQVTTTRREHIWSLTAVGVALAGLALFTGVLAAGPAPADRPVGVTFHGQESVSQPFRYARIDRQADTWVLVGQGQQLVMDRAAVRLPGDHRRAPFAISDDGLHVVYLDARTHRLVLRDLSKPGDPRELTGPLSGGPAPEVTLSADGRYVSVDAEVIDTVTGSRLRLPGVGRVLGLGRGGIVATTGRRALPGTPDTELLTLDLQGVVRTRVPFDPTLAALSTADGRHLAVVTGEEVLTMNAGTGMVSERAKLRLPEHYGRPEALGWAEGGRLLVRIDPLDVDDGAYRLVDPRTGKVSPVDDMPDGLGEAVFGRFE